MNSSKQTVIAITSGKGGVGKTLLAACLGTIVSEDTSRENQVLIADLDFGVKGLTFLYGSANEWQQSRGMIDIFRGEPPDEVLEMAVKVKISKPLNIIYSGKPVKENFITIVPADVDFKQSIEWDEYFPKHSEIENLIENFISCAQNHGFNFIIFDTGAGINRSLVALAKHVHRVIVVVESDEISLTSALDLRGELVQRINNLSFVVNKAPDVIRQIKFESIEDIHFLPRLPFDSKLHLRFVRNARQLARSGFNGVRYKRFVGKIASDKFDIKCKEPTVWDVAVFQKIVRIFLRFFGYGIPFLIALIGVLAITS